MTDRPLVQVPIASTRPNRVGKPTARRVVEQAARSGVFDIEVIDRAAAYFFVMPEYNHSYNAALKNAPWTTCSGKGAASRWYWSATVAWQPGPEPPWHSNRR
ncbi:hypothetical protein ABZY02_35045 [Streptomyces sp. NPDC006649]|uniref:NADPH-dependent FMN reductase n=1 Tax=Streptomyces sp. NPDC006649 TaxID=3156896 RepID=UPI0033AEC098